MAKGKQAKDAGKRYTREALMRDPRFSWIQKDFLGVILSSPFYTIEEAEKAVSNFLRKD